MPREGLNGVHAHRFLASPGADLYVLSFLQSFNSWSLVTPNRSTISVALPFLFPAPSNPQPPCLGAFSICWYTLFRVGSGESMLIRDVFGRFSVKTRFCNLTLSHLSRVFPLQFCRCMYGFPVIRCCYLGALLSSPSVSSSSPL